MELEAGLRVVVVNEVVCNNSKSQSVFLSFYQHPCTDVVLGDTYAVHAAFSFRVERQVDQRAGSQAETHHNIQKATCQGPRGTVVMLLCSPIFPEDLFLFISFQPGP